MFKIFVILSVCVAVVMCAPQEYAAQPEATLVEYVNDNDGTGNYNFKYSLSDGSSRDETGTLKEIQNEDGSSAMAVVMSGSYKFVDPNGKEYTVTYTADENGFHPKIES